MPATAGAWCGAAACIRPLPWSARSTALGADGATWAEFLADVPRFNGTARRLLIGGQRTNRYTNPRFEGATAGVVGSGGVLPTGCSVTTALGLATEVVSVTKSSGVDVLRLRISGTPSSTGTYTLALTSASGVTAAQNEEITLSVLAALSAGATTNFGIMRFRGEERTGGVVTVNTADIRTLLTSSLQRFSGTGTLGTAGTTGLRLLFQAGVTISAAVDITLNIGWPQIEQAPFASNPILPAVGTPAASTRGADLVSATLSSLGIGASGACTLLWSGMIPQNAPSGADQMLMQIDAGADTNRFRLRNVAGGATIVAGRVASGVSSDATSLGSMTAGTLFRAGISINGAGRIAGCFNGGTVQAVTGGPTSGLTTLRVGNNQANAAPLFSEVATVSVLPFALSDSGLRSAVLALPG